MNKPPNPQTFILELQKWLGVNEFLWSISLNLLQNKRLLWVKKKKCMSFVAYALDYTVRSTYKGTRDSFTLASSHIPNFTMKNYVTSLKDVCERQTIKHPIIGNDIRKSFCCFAYVVLDSGSSLVII